MRKINKLGKRAAALVLAVGLTLSMVPPVLAADADEVQTPAAQTEQQETDTEADEADVDTEADEAAALPELSEDIVRWIVLFDSLFMWVAFVDYILAFSGKKSKFENLNEDPNHPEA